jgi:hypothetical protein
MSLACNEFGIGSAGTLLARLHCCGWVSFKLDQAVQRLWDGIVNLRLEPFFDETENVGPLQTHVSEPDFTDWQNIDWSMLSIHNPTTPRDGSNAPAGGSESLYDFGFNYCSPQQPLLHNINWHHFQ